MRKPGEEKNKQAISICVYLKKGLRDRRKDPQKKIISWGMGARESKPQGGLCLTTITAFIILGCNYLFIRLPLPQACNLFKSKDHALHFCIHRTGTEKILNMKEWMNKQNINEWSPHKKGLLYIWSPENNMVSVVRQKTRDDWVFALHF